jgi:hypothetical protein
MIMLLLLFIIVCCFSAVMLGVSAADDDNVAVLLGASASVDDDNNTTSSSSSSVVLSSFHVSTHVNSRLMNTNINMVFENSANCSSIHTITLQLPKNARVTDLIMDLSDGCQLESEGKI